MTPNVNVKSMLRNNVKRKALYITSNHQYTIGAQGLVEHQIAYEIDTRHGNDVFITVYGTTSNDDVELETIKSIIEELNKVCHKNYIDCKFFKEFSTSQDAGFVRNLYGEDRAIYFLYFILGRYSGINIILHDTLIPRAREHLSLIVLTGELFYY